MNSTCIQCGDDSDLLVAFTANRVCGKCARANHKRAVS